MERKLKESPQRGSARGHPSQEKTPFDRRNILLRNANIDTDTVAEYDRLVQELKRAGVHLKRRPSTYRLEHPLGGDRRRFSNWT